VSGKLTIKQRRTRDTLCRMCERAHIRTDDRGDTIVHCRAMGRRLDRPVTECSMYTEKYSMSLYEMEKIAAIMDPHRRHAGFYMPGTAEHKKLRDED